MTTRISVVIPTFRRPALLQKCLEALQQQIFLQEHFEVIVVSDGPDELTKGVVQHFFQHANITLRYFFLPEKMGPAAARNLGWKRAKGMLIAFTDDDCLPDSNWLQVIWQAYKSDKLIAYSGRVKVPVSESPTDYERNTAGLENAEFITANCCITKEALEITGGFDERFSMAWREDSDLEFKLLLHSVPIVRLVNAVVIHPVRKAPWGVSIAEQRKGMFNALLFKKYPRFYRNKIQPTPPWEYYAMVLLFLLLVTSGLFAKQMVMIICLVAWLLLMVKFIFKRLSGSSHAPDHVAEMIVTSFVIPFASVYWQLYGAWKFKVFFL